MGTLWRDGLILVSDAGMLDQGYEIQTIILIIVKQMSTSFFEEGHAAGSPSTSIVNFIPLEKIGEGSFSSVYKVRRITDDQVYALKKIKIAALKEKQRQNALNEIRILASLNSEYIVQYREAFFDQKLNLLCIVMEYANEGDLQKKIEAHRKSMAYVAENEVWKAAYQTIKGLQLLHSKSILHRDIKSANIFISDGVYKLGDLNVSKVQDSVERMAYTQTGTPYYASPQVWRDEPYDSKSDIWSLGCVLYEMCTYRPPFKGKDLESLFKNVQKGLYDPLPIRYSQQLSDFIGACVKLNPKHRLSCKQLLNLPVMQRKCKELGIEYDVEHASDELLKTIKLPTDLKDLKKKLPKSKYSCSIDNIEMKKKAKEMIEIPIKSSQQLGAPKKYSQADYFLQLAKRKKQIHKMEESKIQRVISQGSILRNPEDDTIRPPSDPRRENNLIDRRIKLIEAPIHRLKLNYQEESLLKQKGLRVKQLTPRSQRDDRPSSGMKINLEDRYKLEQLPQLQRYRDSEKLQLRKQSQDYESPRSGKSILNAIQLMKKLSQPVASVSKCLSQRYIGSEAQMARSKGGEVETERLLRQDNERLVRNIMISNKNEELAEIEKKVEEKRRELRKIGSIQRLQVGSSGKTPNNLSYRAQPLVLNPKIKKSGVHLSSILLKSPTSTTQQQPSRPKQKTSSTKKLQLSGNGQIAKVSSTPYMMGILEAPRIKRIMENIQESKKVRESDLKHRMLSHRYLHRN